MAPPEGVVLLGLHAITILVMSPVLYKIFRYLMRSWNERRSDGTRGMRGTKAIFFTIPLGTLILYLIVFSIVAAVLQIPLE